MDIEQLTAQKQKLESRLTNLVYTELSAFQEQTDVSPSNIVVNMVDITGISDARQRYIIGNVEVEIKI